MKYSIFILGLLLMGVAGCDDDAKQDPTSSDASGEADAGLDSGASGGAPSREPDAAAPSAVACEPGGPGACQTESDCEAIDDGSAAMGAVSCGTCVIDPDPPACFAACLAMESGLSAACSACYSDLAACSFESCALPCLMGTDGAACRQCQLDNGCSPAFVECSGVGAP
jgi:hypothetical protein